MNYPLSKDQTICLYRTSHLFLAASIYAIYRGYYTISIGPGSIFLTSILYWIEPDYSWRRYLDMAVSKTGFTYQLLLAYNAENGKAYYATVLTAALFYPLGMYFSAKENYWASTYSHMGLHILRNIANIILYSGAIPNLDTTKIFSPPRA